MILLQFIKIIFTQMYFPASYIQCLGLLTAFHSLHFAEKSVLCHRFYLAWINYLNSVEIRAE